MTEDKKLQNSDLDKVSGGSGTYLDGHFGARIEACNLKNYIGQRFVIADIEDNYDPIEGYLMSISEDGERAFFEHRSPWYTMSYPLSCETDVYYLYV